MLTPLSNLSKMRVGLVNRGLENLGLEYVSGLLKKKGHDVRLFHEPDLFGVNDNVFHSNALNKLLNLDRVILKNINKFKPHVLGFSVYTTNFPWCLNIAKQVKASLKVPIVFGGHHPTIAPDVVISYDCVDFVIRGEGEYPFLELVECIAKSKDVSKIKNLVLRKKGRVIFNPLRPPVDINKLEIDKPLFEDFCDFRSDYLITTSRGCVFSCTYCCESFYNRLYNHRFHRRRKVQSIIKELETMKDKYKFKEVFFFDAIFFSDKKWLRELMAEYRRKIKVPFKCEGHVKFLDEEVARILKKSNCYGIAFGIQTMNEAIRKGSLHRYETNKDIERALRICDKFKLNYDLDHMFGLPGESEKDYVDSARFYSTLKNLNRIKYNYLTYFPGTEIVSIAYNKGLLTKNDLVKINQGKTKSFFDGGFVDMDRSNRTYISFEKLFKILPIIPKRVVNWLLHKKRYLLFSYVPSILILILQIIIAVRKRDLRFWVYARRYIFTIPKVIAQRLSLW